MSQVLLTCDQSIYIGPVIRVKCGRILIGLDFTTSSVTTQTLVLLGPCQISAYQGTILFINFCEGWYKMVIFTLKGLDLQYIAVPHRGAVTILSLRLKNLINNIYKKKG